MAVYDPLSVTNNRVGVHILSPDEIEEASKLVNNDNQGSWGYITVPIQATDRDRDKWTRFMKRMGELRLIPIIRVATYGDGPHWIKPGDNDLIDFANFLDELPWPVKNRYVIIFNEVNRADEYGGAVSPEDYTDILSNAIDIFKSRSDKFFILPSALDNAAPNGNGFMRWDVYLTRMYRRNPDVFSKIDGWNSHAYGNPAFSANPALSGSNKADSFKTDMAFLNQFTKRKLPVFITEAGWSRAVLDDRTIATFYNHAFYNLWNNDQVVAVTPFLFFAGTAPFDKFSLLTKDRQKTLAYQTIQSFASTGQPLLENYPDPAEASTKGGETPAPTPTEIIAVLGEASEAGITPLTLWQKIISLFKNLFHPNPFSKTIIVAGKTYDIEVVSHQSDTSVGLAKYQSLAANQGMLFDFKVRHQPNFWMKNMKFDIDLVWIDGEKVVGVSSGFAATPYALIPAPAPVTRVLEVNPNSDIKVGDTIKFK